jgi:hypothetical protein
MNCLRKEKKQEEESSEDEEEELSCVDDKPLLRSESRLTASSSLQDEHDYAKYGLSSPPKGKRAVPLEDALKRMKKDGRECKEMKRLCKKLNKEGHDSDMAKMLIFLYGKGFMWNKDKKERVKSIIKMVTNEKASERLLQILQLTGDTNLLSDPSCQDIYKNHVLALKRYFRLTGSFGFLRNMEEAEFYFRFQKSGNCFLQAPSVMVSYLLQKRAETNKDLSNFSPLDVSRFVRNTFSDGQLRKYVVKDGGGNSIDVLTTVGRRVSGDTGNFRVIVRDSEEIRNSAHPFLLQTYLEQYGPGLVAGFQVSKYFQRAAKLNNKGNKIGIVRFDGVNDKGKFIPLMQEGGAEVDEQDQKSIMSIISNHSNPSVKLFEANNIPALQETLREEVSERESNGGEMHAMVLLGGRRDEENPKKTYLLFQNWWPGMPLVEISDDYYKASGGSLVFVSTKGLAHFDSLNHDSFYARNNSLMAECNKMDRAESWERFVPEDEFLILERFRSA